MGPLKNGDLYPILTWITLLKKTFNGLFLFFQQFFWLFTPCFWVFLLFFSFLFSSFYAFSLLFAHLNLFLKHHRATVACLCSGTTVQPSHSCHVLFVDWYTVHAIQLLHTCYFLWFKMYETHKALPLHKCYHAIQI